MKKRISLRLRLTLITSFILTLVCVAFTLFSLYNANSSFGRIVERKLVEDTQSSEIINNQPATESLPTNENKESNDDMKTAMELSFNTFSTTSYIFMLISIIIGTIIMYIIAGVILKPVKLLAQKITEIDKNELSFRIEDFSAGDELNKLADSFNTMLTRLEETFTRESRFSADAAHELKTPLTVIKTNLDVLYLDDSPTKQECLESLAVVKKQTNRMIDLVEDLLAMSTANGCSIDSLVQVNEMIEEITQELTPRINEKHILLQLDVKPCSVKANSVMFKHAISNIIENAIKYNYQDGKIKVTAYPEESKCVIYISDTGIGISEEHAKYIFEPFYRADKSRSRAIGGAGLGLSIAMDIIAKHQGTIGYSSANPKGSVFKVVLPLA